LLTKYEAADDTAATTTTTTTTLDDPQQKLQEEETEQQMYQRKKLERAEKKRQEAKEREVAEQTAIQEAQALPNAKQTELQQMQLPEYGTIVDVPADGHCLYRAIAAQLSTTTTIIDYRTVRNLAADGLLKHRDTLEAFCESHYDDYVDRVRSSADWGGHLELRALSFMLHRPIIIYSTNPPLTIGDNDERHDDNHGEQDQAAAAAASVEPIRLSYHLHYYALGEHYNHVVIRPTSSADPAEDERK
jgi:OTU domain-containing protein 6